MPGTGGNAGFEVRAGELQAAGRTASKIAALIPGETKALLDANIGAIVSGHVDRVRRTEGR
ncbi:hypothetical protein [Kitasatospora sp. NPDC015120]|uniref:hypothetical protein n=1 Tax=Kitasatospora sp. NPDC015120 TaxID=3364023 RepID=UPI0036F464C5